MLYLRFVRSCTDLNIDCTMQKVPQTSVAPTYKLTLPSEFVLANLSHLIDQSFDLTDKDGKDVWRVALLPRR